MMQKLVMTALLVLSSSAIAHAQQVRVRVTVDYVTAGSVYLSAGESQGLFAADTVQAQRDTTAAGSTRLLIVNSSRARAVATVLDSSYRVTRGDVLFLTLPSAALQRLSQASAPAAPAVVPAPAVLAPVQPATPPTGRHARLSGRVGLELSALHAWTQYGTGENQVTENTYLNPTFRLRLNVDDLPGGVRFTSNLRAAYFGGSSARPSSTSIQLYQASAETGAGQGVHVRLGRFYNSYESHSGYWDGALLRVGSPHIGGGVVVGYAPQFGNQQLSTTAPKVSAFVDGHVRSRNWRYDIDVGAHRQEHPLLDQQREFIGVTQVIGLGRSYFTQRVQAGRVDGGDIHLWQGQVSARIAVAGPFSVNARYSTERNDVFFAVPGIAGQRARWSAGAMLSGRTGFVNVEGGAYSSATDTHGTIASAQFYLPSALRVVALGFSGSTSQDETARTTFAAPYFERVQGRLRARLGGSYYRTDYGSARFEQKGADVTLALPLGRRSELSMTAAGSTGGNVRTARTIITLWQSF
ncbi:MAG TPA: hypothetical protein VGD27_06620 [Longimicrobiales bacterium]